MVTPKEVRLELHALITDTIGGHGIETADIYPFRTARFRDSSPTHAVVTTHRLSAAPLNQGDQLPYYFYRLLLFARYNDQASELAAEDALDSLELMAIAALAEAGASDLWESIEFLDGPERTSLEISGKFYRFAQQLIKVEIN